MTLRDLVNQTVAAKAVADELGRLIAGNKAKIMRDLDAGDRKHATVAGVDCGTVSVSSPDERFAVGDVAAFTAWVKTHRPDAIVTTESVRSSDQTSILAGIPESGEIPDGVELVVGDPVVSLRMTQPQRAAMLAAVRAGSIGVPELLPGES